MKYSLNIRFIYPSTIPLSIPPSFIFEKRKKPENIKKSGTATRDRQFTRNESILPSIDSSGDVCIQTISREHINFAISTEQ